MVTVDEALSILRNKHLLICGGTESGRLGLARGVVESATDSETDLCELPAGISTIDHYLRAIHEIFPIFSPIEYLGWLRKLLPFLPTFRMPKSWMNLDQVWDMHLDWVEPRERSLIFWPEATLGDGEGFHDILSDYVSWKYVIEDPGCGRKPEDSPEPFFRLVFTTPHLPENLHEHLRLTYGPGKEDPRSEVDIARELDLRLEG